MSNQIEIPQSFVSLFLRAGTTKPSKPWEDILDRYEVCEDMANLLVDTASRMLFDLKITPEDVLERCHAGLAAPESGFSAPESGWVATRLAELQGWALPSFQTSHEQP